MDRVPDFGRMGGGETAAGSPLINAYENRGAGHLLSALLREHEAPGLGGDHVPGNLSQLAGEGFAKVQGAGGESPDAPHGFSQPPTGWGTSIMRRFC